MTKSLTFSIRQISKSIVYISQQFGGLSFRDLSQQSALNMLGFMPAQQFGMSNINSTTPMGIPNSNVNFPMGVNNTNVSMMLGLSNSATSASASGKRLEVNGSPQNNSYTVGSDMYALPERRSAQSNNKVPQFVFKREAMFGSIEANLHSSFCRLYFPYIPYFQLY